MALAKFFLSKQVTSTCSTIIQMSSPTPTNLVAARIHQLDEPLRSHSVQEEALDESESRYANPQGYADSTRSASLPTDVNNVLTRFVQYSPQLEAASYRRKRLGWNRWWLDETSSKGKGQWRYLDRAVNQTAQTLDLLPTDQRDQDAALSHQGDPPPWYARNADDRGERGRRASGVKRALTVVQQFSSLAARAPVQQGTLRPRSQFATHPNTTIA
jgi:DDE domain